MGNTYICTEGFNVTVYDDDENYEIGTMLVEKGTIWDLDNSHNRILGGEVRLTNEDCEWLEIPRKRLAEYFEVAKKEETDG